MNPLCCELSFQGKLLNTDLIALFIELLIKSFIPHGFTVCKPHYRIL